MQINGRILIFWDDFRIKLNQRTDFSFGKGFRKMKGTLPTTCFHFFKSQSHINPLSPQNKRSYFLFVVFCICRSNLTRSSLMIPTQPTTHTARFSSSSSTSWDDTANSTGLYNFEKLCFFHGCTTFLGPRNDYSLQMFFFNFSIGLPKFCCFYDMGVSDFGHNCDNGNDDAFFGDETM